MKSTIDAAGVDKSRSLERDAVINDALRMHAQHAVEFVRAIEVAQFQPVSRAVAEEHAELNAKCRILGVPLNGNETTDQLRWLYNHYAVGRHIRQTAHETAVALQELTEQFNKIQAAARKQRNAKKRERRARRGKR